MPYNANPTKISQRANLLKAELIKRLGGKCVQCGSETMLEINHIYGRTWQPRKLTHYRRVLRYRKEAAEGLLNVLCEECNKVYRPVARG